MIYQKHLHSVAQNLCSQPRVSFLVLQDYVACSSDLQEVLQQDPNVQEAEKELEEVTALLRQTLANSSSAKPRKSVPITEVRLQLTVRGCWLLIEHDQFVLLHCDDLW